MMQLQTISKVIFRKFGKCLHVKHNSYRLSVFTLFTHNSSYIWLLFLCPFTYTYRNTFFYKHLYVLIFLNGYLANCNSYCLVFLSAGLLCTSPKVYRGTFESLEHKPSYSACWPWNGTNLVWEARVHHFVRWRGNHIHFIAYSTGSRHDEIVLLFFWTKLTEYYNVFLRFANTNSSVVLLLLCCCQKNSMLESHPLVMFENLTLVQKSLAWANLICACLYTTLIDIWFMLYGRDICRWFTCGSIFCSLV